MHDSTSPCYAFGPYVLDRNRGILWKDGVRVPLTPRVFELLATLVAHSGELLDKDELIRRVWAGVTVEENNLTRQVCTLRKILHERPGESEFIVTVPGVGYRFVAPVRMVESVPTPQAAAAPQGGSPMAAPPVSSPAAAASRWTWLRIAAAFAASAALVAAGAGLVVFHARAAATALAPRALEQFTAGDGIKLNPAWSPDGRQVAYASNRVGGNFDIFVEGTDGSAPVRLTTSTACDWQPDWSPDGRSIVFRSERDGGGLYVVPAAGGPEVRLTAFGWRPRWSPSGEQILFSNAAVETARAVRLYVVSRHGGDPVAIEEPAVRRMLSTSAAWSPDGRVSFLGRDDQGWTMVTVGVDGSNNVRSAVPAPIAQRLDAGDPSLLNFVWAPSRRFLYFEGLSNSVRNIWRVGVDPATLAWTGDLERLTTDAGADMGLSIAPDGSRLAFSILGGRSSTWAFAFDPVNGRITDSGKEVTSGDPNERGSDAWVDGSKLLYLSTRSNRQELWEQTLFTGPRLLTSAADWTYTPPRWSKDGKKIVYLRTRGTSRAASRTADRMIGVFSVDSGREEAVPVPAGLKIVPTDWSADGSTILTGCHLTPGDRMGTCTMTLDETTHQKRLSSDPRIDMFQQRFSPNERWVSFIGVPTNEPSVTTVYLMPRAGGSWIPVTDGAAYDDKPRWAPDGRTLYFTSNRDGHANVWGRRIDPLTGEPLGDAFRVTSFQDSHLSISPVWQLEMSVASDRLFLPMFEGTGQVWVLDHVDQ